MGQILVVGATGTVGSELARHLTEQGHTVKAATRSAQPKAGQVRLDVATQEGLAEAFEGVDRAFFLAPPGYADHYQVLAPLIAEAKKRQLKKVVLMTAMGADAVDTSPMRRAELDLERSGLRYHIIRPNWFMQNFHTFWLHGIRTQGKILLPVGDAKVSFIDARDISAVAAKLLTDDQVGNTAHNLTGGEALDHAEVATLLSEGTGKAISYQEIAPEQLKEGLLQAGLPEDYVDFLLMILAALKAGYSAALTSEVQAILGRPPADFRGYVRDYRAAWLEQATGAVTAS